MDEAARHFVDRAIAAHSGYGIYALSYGLGCEFGGMAWRLGISYIIRKPRLIEVLIDQSRNTLFGLYARIGVDDKDNMLSVHTIALGRADSSWCYCCR